ncbi:hypothetical protein GCM10010532_065850 [Dactylosporangium siamense]|uniref:Uncharacterized protein n=2 Tax=Dactylosporangium siamense TaxID=685454 RepID=A0A919PQJ6_9ACTN|nr:hypothetical protein Dsi01nite_047110 [Dactylosporangium siamense]
MELHQAVVAPWPVATLALEPAEVQTRLGLRFTEVPGNLGDELLAYGQLSDGTVLGFSRLIGHRRPGVDVSQYARRAPRDVLTELLFETGLSHDEVSWRAPSDDADDGRLWARTNAEAYAYFLLHRQPGDPHPDLTQNLTIVRDREDPDVRSVQFLDFIIHLRARPFPLTSIGTGSYSEPDDPPSGIIDPGGWMFLATQWEASANELLQAYGPRIISVDEYWAVYYPLLQLENTADEALRFLPPDVDEMPVRMFWTPIGLWMRRRNPHAFNRAVLSAKSTEYRTAFPEFLRIYGPPPK